jgi:hypothetical protein
MSGFLAVVYQYWERLTGGEDGAARRWFWIWAAKGLATPIVLWIACNAGLLPGLAPLIPEAALARTPAERVAVLVEAATPAVFVVGSHWSAVTLAWVLATVAFRIPEDNRARFRTRVLGWSLLVVPVGSALVYGAGWGLGGFAVMLWLLPIAHDAIPMLSLVKEKPIYARAIAKMKFGRSQEAEWAVIQELEKCADDFDGWMLLAELYALHFKDLVVADRTIREMCDQPDLHPSQVGVALHRLADWHLSVGNDPIAARRALEEICRRYPGLHLDRMARLRISQLPASREEWIEQRRGRTFRLPGVQKKPVESVSPVEWQARPGPEGDTAEAVLLAEQCVAKLRQNPDDVPAREKLARLFAERLGLVDQALEQIDLLLGMPDRAPQKMVEWLSQKATWQLRYRRDLGAARQVLEQLIHEHPQTPQAFEAQKRILLMDVEQRLRRAGRPPAQP